MPVVLAFSVSIIVLYVYCYCSSSISSAIARVGSGAILLHRVNCSRQAGLALAGSSGRVWHSTLSASSYNMLCFSS